VSGVSGVSGVRADLPAVQGVTHNLEPHKHARLRPELLRLECRKPWCPKSRKLARAQYPRVRKALLEGMAQRAVVAVAAAVLAGPQLARAKGSP